jgi:hypothetical protein
MEGVQSLIAIHVARSLEYVIVYLWDNIEFIFPRNLWKNKVFVIDIPISINNRAVYAYISISVVKNIITEYLWMSPVQLFYYFLSLWE